ncbi:MAG: hypothetical protein JO130_18655 [Solirubrobacterales bacterium]|nr:hypothetical protein [Solirubrobacterales bacterium]
MTTFILAVAFVMLVGTIALRSERRKLRAAPRGSIRVETTKAAFANSTIRRYVEQGWTVQGQSATKSFGSQPQVTITFKKGL